MITVRLPAAFAALEVRTWVAALALAAGHPLDDQPVICWLQLRRDLEHMEALWN